MARGRAAGGDLLEIEPRLPNGQRFRRGRIEIEQGRGVHRRINQRRQPRAIVPPHHPAADRGRQDVANRLPQVIDARERFAGECADAVHGASVPYRLSAVLWRVGGGGGRAGMGGEWEFAAGATDYGRPAQEVIGN